MYTSGDCFEFIRKSAEFSLGPRGKAVTSVHADETFKSCLSGSRTCECQKRPRCFDICSRMISSDIFGSDIGFHDHSVMKLKFLVYMA